MRFIQSFLIILITSSSLVFSQSPSQSNEGSVRIVQLLRQENSIRRYPDALPSLLKMLNEQSNARFFILTVMNSPIWNSLRKKEMH